MMKKTIYGLIVLATAFFLFKEEIWAASCYFSGVNKAKVNSVFSLPVMLNTKGVAVNAIEITLVFDPQMLTVKSIENVSVFSFFLQKNIDNALGKINVIAAQPAPGFSGMGQLFTLNVQAKKIGKTEISFSNSSRILSNIDNANIYTPSESIELTIIDNSIQDASVLSQIDVSPFPSPFSCPDVFSRFAVQADACDTPVRPSPFGLLAV